MTPAPRWQHHDSVGDDRTWVVVTSAGSAKSLSEMRPSYMTRLTARVCGKIMRPLYASVRHDGAFGATLRRILADYIARS